jgi:pyridoxal phosphate enzyme (YggS family)
MATAVSGGSTAVSQRSEVDIAANVARVRERIARAAERAGRRPEDIRLVGVSKLVEAERVRRAIAAGLTDVGENYVQEAAAKRPEVGDGARWHMVGHLQRNKAGQAVEIFDMVHTVDSPRLARALGRRAEAAGRTVEVLLQVNTSGEESKFGVPPESLDALADAAAAIPGIRVTGLMTIGRWDIDPERARPEFRLLARLAERLREHGGLGMHWLSMGMSHDFDVAIEEGANLVRVGTAIFGPRPK